MSEANKLRISVWLKYDGDAPLLMVSSDEKSGEQTVKQLARQSLDAGQTEWSSSASAADDDGRRRINPLLAVANHLDWLCAVHAGQPGISVTAR